MDWMGLRFLVEKRRDRRTTSSKVMLILTGDIDICCWSAIVRAVANPEWRADEHSRSARSDWRREQNHSDRFRRHHAGDCGADNHRHFRLRILVPAIKSTRDLHARLG